MARPLYLVSYDIRCQKRWRRVFARLKHLGEHRQLSVFLLRMETRAVNHLEAEIRQMIDLAQDSVLIVRLDAGPDAIREAGRSGRLPGGRVIVM